MDSSNFTVKNPLNSNGYCVFYYYTDQPEKIYQDIRTGATNMKQAKQDLTDSISAEYKSLFRIAKVEKVTAKYKWSK